MINVLLNKSVIEFNNWFFEGLKKFLNEEKQLIYENQEQKSTGKNEGFAEVSFVEAEKEELDEANFELIASKIDECLEDGFEQKDITILVNKNKQGTKISKYLIALSNPFGYIGSNARQRCASNNTLSESTDIPHSAANRLSSSLS